MDGLPPLLWLVLGALLVGSELFTQTFVALFLGVAALVLAALTGAGVVDGLVPEVALWAVLSALLTIPLRPLAMRWFPGKQQHHPGDEDTDAYGEVVDVLEPVTEGDVKGRIRFQGTTWPAMCADGSIPAGGKAKLLYRDKLAWVVEPLPMLEGADVVPAAQVASRDETDR